MTIGLFCVNGVAGSEFNILGLLVAISSKIVATIWKQGRGTN